MSATSGRLSSVLRIRTLAERRAMGQVAAARRDLAAARDRLALRVEAARPAVPTTRSLTPLQLRVLELQGLAHHDLVLDAISEVELGEDRCAELARAWSHASVQRKSVERLQEQRSAIAAVESRTAADRALDEAILLRRRTP